jgi:hypothetical protein
MNVYRLTIDAEYNPRTAPRIAKAQRLYASVLAAQTAAAIALQEPLDWYDHDGYYWANTLDRCATCGISTVEVVE